MSKPFERQTNEDYLQTLSAVEGPLMHAVQMRFHDEASHEDVTQAVQMVEGLRDLPGILSWMVVPQSLDERKGRRLLELGVFENGQALLDFRTNPDHTEVTDHLRNVADWDIVDFPLTEAAAAAAALLSQEVDFNFSTLPQPEEQI